MISAERAHLLGLHPKIEKILSAAG